MCTTERRYNENQLELNKNDMHEVWKTMKDIIGKIIDSRKQYVDGSTTKDQEKNCQYFQ